MKFLVIYKENDEFVMEIDTDSMLYGTANTVIRRYTTESEFVKGLQSYKPVIQEYDVIASKELESIISIVFLGVYVSYQ